MRDFIDRLRKMEIEMARKKGPFHLFALFTPEFGLGSWDLVISAPWADDNEVLAIRYVAREMKRTLRPKDRERIALIAIVDSKNHNIRELQRRVRVEHGVAEVHNLNLFETSIDHAYIITSQKKKAA